MKATFIDRCMHVLDKEATIAFYEEVLGLKVDCEFGPADGSWANTFMVDATTGFELELTWNDGRTELYENRGPDSHIAFHALHERMGCIVCENPYMGLYFIADSEGQWIEVLLV